MKTSIKKLLRLTAFIAGICLIPGGRVAAQTFTTLYSFTNGIDGANPYAYQGLVLSSNILYGTAYYGGPAGNGSVFAINTDGSGFTNLYCFDTNDTDYGSGGYGDPQAGLILSGNTLYGTARTGGTSNFGSVFKLNTDGTGFTIWTDIIKGT